MGVRAQYLVVMPHGEGSGMPELRAPETVCPARSRAVSWARRPVTTLSDKVVRPGSEMRSVKVCLDRWRARVQFRFKAARIPL